MSDHDRLERAATPSLSGGRGGGGASAARRWPPRAQAVLRPFKASVEVVQWASALPSKGRWTAADGVRAELVERGQAIREAFAIEVRDKLSPCAESWF
jgi:hypothetical protein